MEILFNISSPLPMAFAAETHVAEGQINNNNSNNNNNNNNNNKHKGKIERGFKREMEKQGNAWEIHKKYR
jgi:hypothetical protein